MLSKVLYAAPFAHLTGHPPFECAKETRILKDNGVDVELLTFCGVHEGFNITVNHTHVMPDNALFRKLRQRFVTQWALRVFEYSLTILKAAMIAKDRPIYLRDGEPFPHLVHILNVVGRKRWVISSTGGLYTTGEGVSRIYKTLLKLTTVGCKFWYRLSRDKIKYSVQNQSTLKLMQPLLGDNISVVPLGHRLNDKMERSQARKDLGIPDTALVLLALGANHSGKNSEVIFQALAHKMGIVLIHAGPSRQSLGANPEDLELKYKVGAKVFNRQIGDEEKKRLFGAADWAVLSYNTNFASTTSMLWESCSYKVPVIASSGNELEKLVKYWNLGLIFQAGDKDDLELHIDMAHSDGIRQSFINNCQDFLSFYSEEQWFQATAKLLE